MTSVEHFRHCPYCSAELGTYDDFRRVCPQCAGVVYDNAAAAAGIFLLNDDDHVLLTRRGEEPYKGSHGVPGGFCQPGESALETIYRETEEETGLTDFEVIDFLGSFPDRYGDTGPHTLNFLFVGRLRSGDPTPADDVESLEWVDVFRTPDKVFAGSFRNTREALAALRAWKESGTVAPDVLGRPLQLPNRPR